MSANTKVIVFLDADELAILDDIGKLAMCSRQDAIRFLLSERRRAAVKFKAVKASPEPKRGRPPRAKPVIEGGME